MVISIKSANYVEDYKIHFEFSDGTQRTVDFGPFLLKAKNPTTQKYLNKEKFQQFDLKHGDIQWNDYKLCFPNWDIYEGNI